MYLFVIVVYARGLSRADNYDGFVGYDQDDSAPNTAMPGRNGATGIAGYAASTLWICVGGGPL